MPKLVQSKQYLPFIKGLFTEASMVNFPEGATIDEDNFYLTRLGIRERRLGLNLDRDGVWVVPVGNYTKCSKPSLCNLGEVIVPIESYCDYVTLYLKGNDYIDEVGGAVDAAPAGAPAIGVSIDTSSKPYGTASIKFEGNVGYSNYYVLSQNSPKGSLLGSGAYTVDIIFKMDASDTQGGLFINSLRTTGLFVQVYDNKYRVFYWEGSGYVPLWMTTPGAFGDITVTKDTWIHLRVARDSSMNVRLYISENGGTPVSYGPVVDTLALDMISDGAQIGYDTNVGAFMGHVKMVRTLKGLALDESTMPATDEFPYDC